MKGALEGFLDARKLSLLQDFDERNVTCAVHWIYEYFFECINSDLEMASFIVALVSIVFWVLSQFPFVTSTYDLFHKRYDIFTRCDIPPVFFTHIMTFPSIRQVLTNFRRQDASALSGHFLFLWTLGDVLSFSGIMLSHHYSIQLYSTVFYIVMDVALSAQWIYYLVKKKLHERKLQQIEKREIEEAAYLLNNSSNNNNHHYHHLYPHPSKLESAVGAILGEHTPIPQASERRDGENRHQWSESEEGSDLAAYDTQDEDLYSVRVANTTQLNSYTESSSVPNTMPSAALIQSAAITATQTKVSATKKGTKIPHNAIAQKSSSSTTPHTPLPQAHTYESQYLQEGSLANSLILPHSVQPRKDSSNIFSLLLPFVIVCGVASLVLGPSLFMSTGNKVVPVRIGRTLLSSAHKENTPLDDQQQLFSDFNSIVGFIMQCVAVLIYILSRIPQIILNWRRRSVAGLSALMFLLAILGNITFTIAVVLRNFNEHDLLLRLPMILCGTGTILFDVCILIQCWRYNKQESVPIFHDIQEEHKTSTQ